MTPETPSTTESPGHPDGGVGDRISGRTQSTVSVAVTVERDRLEASVGASLWMGRGSRDHSQGLSPIAMPFLADYTPVDAWTT